MRILLLLLCAACSGDGDPDFALIAPDDTVVLVRGQQGAIEVEVERSGGLAGTIIVTASNLRAGITPGALPLPADQPTGTLQLVVESSTELGPIEGALLVGVAGELERTTPVQLEVTDP